MNLKTLTLSALAALIIPTAAHADSTQRYFTRVGKTTYVSQRCYCGHTKVIGSYSGKDRPVSLAAFDCEEGLTFALGNGNPASPFEYEIWVENRCYRWMIIAPQGKVTGATISREP